MIVKLSPIKWFGGKYRMVKYILPFPEHSIYVEVFGGSGVVLLNKHEVKCEIYNDINSRLLNFWRVLKDYRHELKALIETKENIQHRDIFNECLIQSPDKIEDAYRFFYVNRHSHGANNIRYQGYQVSRHNSSMGAYLHHIERIDKIHKRIERVHFDNKDFRKLLKNLDRENTVWYLDPPYFKGGEQYEKGISGHSWTLKDHEDLREILLNVKKAKFVLSIDNIEFFNNPDWFYEKIERVNAAGGVKKDGKKTRVYEYIIRNFDPQKPSHEWEEEGEVGDFMLL